MGVEGSVLSVQTQFLSNRSQYVVVDGCQIKLVNAVSVEPQGKCFGPSACTPIVVNKLCGYSDDSSLITVVPSSSERVAVRESSNRDLNKFRVWGEMCGMKLKTCKTKIIIVSRLRTVDPQSNPLTLSGLICA